MFKILVPSAIGCTYQYFLTDNNCIAEDNFPLTIFLDEQ